MGPPFGRGIELLLRFWTIVTRHLCILQEKTLYGLCPKLHFQNACPKLHKRSKLRSYGGTYRKQFLCSFTFELKKKKKSGTQLYLCDEYGNSLQKNNFLVGHEIPFVFITIITTAEISNEWTLIAEFNDDFAWKEGEIERPTQRHKNTEVNSFSRVSPLKGSVYRVRQSPQLSSQFLCFRWFPMMQSSKCPWSMRKKYKKKYQPLSACHSSVTSYTSWVFVPFPHQNITGKGCWFIWYFERFLSHQPQQMGSWSLIITTNGAQILPITLISLWRYF